MAFVTVQHEEEMLQKGHMQLVFARRLTSGSASEISETDDTDFEEDVSDFEGYSGRRSEESVSERTRQY